MENTINNNNITLIGVVEKEAEYSHEVFGEGYYIFMLKCLRTSGNEDVLPVMISDRLTDIREIKVGQAVTVLGQIRSFNKHTDNMKSKLILTVFAREFEVLTQDSEELPLKIIPIWLHLTLISVSRLYTDVLQRAERLQIS